MFDIVHNKLEHDAKQVDTRPYAVPKRASRDDQNELKHFVQIIVFPQGTNKWTSHTFIMPTKDDITY